MHERKERQAFALSFVVYAPAPACYSFSRGHGGAIMTIWYYAVGQDRKGPLGEDEFREMIDRGEITSETYVWQKGMDGWQAAGDHPDLANSFAVPPPLPTPPSPAKLPRPAFQPAEAKPGVVLTSRPWPRFWARLFDNLLFVPLLGFGIGFWSAMYAPGFYLELVAMNEVLFGLLLMPLVALVLAISMILTGSTPGKAIVGVRVPVPPGASRAAFYLAREFKVWFAGLGLGIPLVALFTQVAQYRRLAAGRPASYDEGSNPAVFANPGKLRLGVAIALLAVLSLGNIILRTEDRQMTDNLTRTQNWVSPVTGKTATIARTWRPQPIDANGGSAFYFISNELLSEAIFGHETLPSGDVEALAYANAIQTAISPEITINTDWRPVQLNGMSALRATGIATQAADAAVEVTVAVREQDAWRTLMFTRGTSAAQLNEKERFVKAMFGTAN